MRVEKSFVITDVGGNEVKFSFRVIGTQVVMETENWMHIFDWRDWSEVVGELDHEMEAWRDGNR